MEAFSATCSADVAYEEKGSNRTVKSRDSQVGAIPG